MAEGGAEQERGGAEDKPKACCPALHWCHLAVLTHMSHFTLASPTSQWAGENRSSPLVQSCEEDLPPCTFPVTAMAEIRFRICHTIPMSLLRTAGSPPFQGHTASRRLLAVPSVPPNLLQMQIAVFYPPTPKYLDL